MVTLPCNVIGGTIWRVPSSTSAFEIAKSISTQPVSLKVAEFTWVQVSASIRYDPGGTPHISNSSPSLTLPFATKAPHSGVASFKNKAAFGEEPSFAAGTSVELMQKVRSE